MMQNETINNKYLTEIENLKERIAFLEKKELIRNQIEISLKEQERAYFSLLNNLPGVAYRCLNDRDWTMHFISSGCEQLTGYNAFDLLLNKLLSFNEIITEDHRERLWAKRKIILSEKINFQDEYTIKCKDGSIKWVFEMATGIYSDDGSVIAIEGFITDITAQKKAQKELEKNEEKYRFIFNNSTLGLFHYDKFGLITACNDKFVQIIGSSRDKILKLNLLQLKDADLVEAARKSLTGEASFYEGDYHSVTTEKVTPVKVFFSPIKVLENQITGGVAIVEDYTEQRIIEKAFIESEDRFFSLYTNMSEGVALQELLFNENGIAVDYKIIDVNNKFEKVTGLKKEQVLFKKATDIYNIKTPPYLLEYASAAIDKINISFETYSLELDKYFSISVSPMGENRFATIFTDITYRKKAEEELNIYNKELSKINQEYLSLNEEYVSQNEALLIAKEKAEESDRLKSAFLANMSHEIRTPMNGIMGFSDLLKNINLTIDERFKYADIINNSCNQLLSIINDIIDISKIEAGQVIVSNTAINLYSLMNDICNLFQSYALNNHVDLLLQQGLSVTGSNVLIDQVKVKQILSNLLSNAIKFSSNESVYFGYELENNMLKFFVKDNGIGIASEFHDIIFDRFSQVETTDSKQYGGTGLGLAISKSLVEMMGGEIWVESEKEKGATFFFTIPFVSTDYQGLNATNDGVNFKYRNWTDKVVLIAEDEITNFIYLKKALSKTKIDVIRATNGQQAVDYCKSNNNIDIVLMDIKMSEMNGYQATKEIKKVFPNLPIIAQTAYAMSDDESKALNAGCNAYISKPIDIYKLLDLIDEYI